MIGFFFLFFFFLVRLTDFPLHRQPAHAAYLRAPSWFLFGFECTGCLYRQYDISEQAFTETAKRSYTVTMLNGVRPQRVKTPERDLSRGV